ncbi:hypothetical protein FE257_002459 [Aspergillus nanangensis]|uniref:PNPLA domain-containing protein n=1 Tax=Aspergillus nanangensis TaxID=2582783 RepID=A0AAD4CUK6_ASPNN|nr:hypothetical protein FE257_002459 [Aspergillus nanangensis]
MAERQLNILSLDGGGVRGLSTLHILKEVLESVGAERTPKPCEYFDIIGGSGSGGLIAILLGRLKLDIDECIDLVWRLYEQVFRKKRHLPIGSNLRTRPKYDSKWLEFAIRAFLHGPDQDEEMLLKDSDASCKVYPSKYASTELYKTVKVWDACAACVAMPTLFDPIPIGTSGRCFHDSSIETNNPMRDLWIEAKAIWPSGTLESQLRCMVSIGAGAPSMKRLSRRFFGLVKTMPERTSDTDAETNKFVKEHSDLHDQNRLFRFEVPNGMADIRPEDCDELTPIVEATVDYLAGELVFKQ